MTTPQTNAVTAPLDLEVIQRCARADVTSGPVNYDYEADRPALLELLGRALAGELLAALRYRRDAVVATGIMARTAAAEFAAHGTQELDHADRIARRMIELGGEPDFSPAGLSERSYAEYRTGHTLTEMIQENLVAERAAVSFYRQLVLWLGDRDPTTRTLLEGILAAEERHAQDMRALLPGRSPPSPIEQES